MRKTGTIKFRMFMLSVVVLLSMSVLGFAGYYTFNLVQNRIALTDMLEEQTTRLHMILRNINEIVLIPDNPQTVKSVRELVQSFGKSVDNLSAQSEDRDLAVAINAKVRPEWSKIQQEVLAFLTIARPSPDDVDTMITFGKLSADTDKVLKLMTELKLESRQHTEVYILRTTVTMGVIVITLLSVMAIILTSISRSIALPLGEISESTEKIAQGNLTIELNVKRNDEIGVLANSFRSMVENLRQMIRQTRGVSTDISHAAESMAETSEQVLASVTIQNKAIYHTVSAMEDVDNSVTNLKESSNNLIDAASATSSASTELAASISQVDDNAGLLDKNAQKAVSDLVEMVASGEAIATSVGKLSHFAQETSQSIEQIGSTILNVQESANRSVELAEQVSRSSSEQGMVAITDAMNGIEDIRNTVFALSEVVNRLGSKSLQIGKIITVIEDIASQTGMLALNAAILAAQAGHHGRSFAVVASEIRTLSDTTFLSTKEIVDVVTSVQAESNSSVKMAQAGMNAVERGVSLIEKVKNALESIYETSLASTKMSHAIHKETSEEVLVINRINASIVTLRDQVDQISCAVLQQNSNTADMNIRMDQIKQIAEEIAVATREQAKTSVEIAHIAEGLLDQSDQINTAVSVQKLKCSAVLSSSNSVQETADQLGELANTMENAADMLRQKARSLSASINSFEV